MATDLSLDDLDPSRLAQRDGEKWASAGDGVLSSWVADMDFPVAPVIREAIRRRVDGDLGYPAWFDEADGGPLGGAYAARMLRRFGHRADPTHVRMFTDVNQALLATVQLVTEPGDGVLLQSPACPPFTEVLEKIGRRAMTVPMTPAGQGWEWDLAEVERLAADVPRRCRVLFLVNPHNPTGHVLRRPELERIAELALRRNLLVISDEVHADLTYEPHRHIPFASLGAEIAARTVTLSSGSKAFNLAGIRCAVAHMGPAHVRAAVDAKRGQLFGQVGVLAVEALKAAWTEGDTWLDQVRVVLDRNRRTLAERLPGPIHYRMPEATFLAWLDCRSLGLDTEPSNFFRDAAKVLFFSGDSFGPEGRGFVRLNFATSGEVLERKLTRIEAAVDRLAVGPHAEQGV